MVNEMFSLVHSFHYISMKIKFFYLLAAVLIILKLEISLKWFFPLFAENLHVELRIAKPCFFQICHLDENWVSLSCIRASNL